MALAKRMPGERAPLEVLTDLTGMHEQTTTDEPHTPAASEASSGGICFGPSGRVRREAQQRQAEAMGKGKEGMMMNSETTRYGYTMSRPAFATPLTPYFAAPYSEGHAYPGQAQQWPQQAQWGATGDHEVQLTLAPATGH